MIYNKFNKFNFQYYLSNLLKINGDPFKDQQILNKQPEVIFDCGANVGDITKIYTKLFPNAHIYAFEPFQDSFLKLKKRFTNETKVMVVNKAIAEFSKVNDFYVYEDTTCNSLFEASIERDSYGILKLKSKISVDAITLDEFCSNESINNIDILKMDIEGGELLALKGSRSLLEREKIKMIYTEVMFAHHFNKGVLFSQINDFLTGFGFSIYNIYNLKRAFDGQLRRADILFVKK